MRTKEYKTQDFKLIASNLGLKCNQLYQENQILKTRLQNTIHEAEQSITRINALLASRSWRITAPLRKMKHKKMIALLLRVKICIFKLCISKKRPDIISSSPDTQKNSKMLSSFMKERTITSVVSHATENELLCLYESTSKDHAINRILVQKLDYFGDFIIGLPALRSLRTAFPDAYIKLICGNWNAESAGRCGLVDDVSTYNYFPEHPQNWDGQPTQPLHVFEQAVEGQWDLALDLHISAETRFLLAHIDARLRAGIGSATLFPILDIALPSEYHQRFNFMSSSSRRCPPVETHAGEQLSLLIELIRIRTSNAYTDRDAIFPTIENVSSSLLDSAAPGNYRIVISPLSNYDLKDWPRENYTTLISLLLHRLNCVIYLVGSPSQRPKLKKIFDTFMDGKVHNLAGYTKWHDLPALLRKADLVICNDSGIAHQAAALNVRTLTIYSGKEQLQTGYPRGDYVRVLKRDTSCSPCQLGDIKECLHDHACLQMITPEDVLKHALDLLTTKTCSRDIKQALPSPLQSI